MSTATTIISSSAALYEESLVVVIHLAALTSHRSPIVAACLRRIIVYLKDIPKQTSA